MNSQTRENTFSKFQNFTIQVPKLYLRGVVVASSAAGNSCYTDREESEDEKRRKKHVVEFCGGVAVSVAPRSLPILPLVL